MDEKELEAAYKELPEQQLQEFEANETLKGLLTSTGEKTSVIRIGTIDVTVRAALPRKLRRKLVDYQRVILKAEDSMTGQSLNEIESSLYPILAEIAISPAELKRPEVWQYLDEKEGLAVTAFTLIMEKMQEQGESTKKFRAK